MSFTITRSKDQERGLIQPDTATARARIVCLLLVCWMVAVALKLIVLQTSNHDWFSARARVQQQGAVPDVPARGIILDRAGRELARDVDAKSFFAVPDEIDDPHETAKRLAGLVGSDASTLEEHLAQGKARGKKFVWIARKLTGEKASGLESFQLGGIHIIEEPIRRYPGDSLASHVLGFVGLDENGLGGVERFQNAALVGQPGKLILEGDARRHFFGSYETGARSGASLRLTLDQIIQFQAEQALAKAVAQAQARSGAAIVLDPHTGEVLALASMPTYDPNKATSFSPEARVNQALQNIYEPGSTFKVVTYSAALGEGLARPEDHIDCQMGSIVVAGRLVHDHKRFGRLTLTEALAKSSNVAAIKLGLRVGDKRMYEYATRFGFGARTGIELPGESPGLLRPVSRWQPSSMGSIAMGQEVGVTAIQMAAAFGAIANGGIRVAPHLIRELRNADGLQVDVPRAEEHRVLSEETAHILSHMLESVTLRGGTASRAELQGYSAAGKTGTAQKIDPRTRTYSKTKYVASFVGFAPVDRPAIVIVVVIDEPVGGYHGGEVAAPVFAEIAQNVLPYLGVAPDTEIKPGAGGGPGQPPVEKAFDLGIGLGSAQIERRESNDEIFPNKTNDNAVFAQAGDSALIMPELRGRSVRDAAILCANLGLRLEGKGEGKATIQDPEPGAKLKPGQTVRVEFRRTD